MTATSQPPPDPIPAAVATVAAPARREGARATTRASAWTRRGALLGGVLLPAAAFSFSLADLPWVAISLAITVGAALLVGTIGVVATRERSRAQTRDGNAERRYQALIEQIPAVVYTWTVNGTVAHNFVSPQVEQIFGLTPEETLADPANWWDVIHPDDLDRVLAYAEQSDRLGTPWDIEYRIQHADGRWVWLHDRASVVLDAAGGPSYWQGLQFDISERKTLEARLAHQAFHDALTGLPNRTLFLERLDVAVGRARRDERQVAVLFFDLDGFKVVNDSLGHAAGDRLLIAVTERLRACLRAGDTLARLGGDEFTVLIENVGSLANATRFADRARAALSDGFVVAANNVAQPLVVSASIGIAIGDGVGIGAADLLRHADIAMYRAKAAGRAGYAVYSAAMGSEAEERLALEGDLRLALDRAEFRLHYQPVVDLARGGIAGFEALIRWQHPTRGLVPPADFIPVAEETGLIVPIGRWVLGEACRQGRRWHDRFPDRPPVIGVNLSPRQFRQPSLSDDVAAALRDSGISPRHLCLEITETVLMDDVEAHAATLDRLRRLGIWLAIDDFGSGYSSLRYLKALPVNVLKIDRSFVAGLGRDPADAAIVEAITTLAARLGMRVTAEGVETDAQLAAATALGCTWGQGYHFARPVPAAAATALLERSPHWRTAPLAAVG